MNTKEMLIGAAIPAIAAMGKVYIDHSAEGAAEAKVREGLKPLYEHMQRVDRRGEERWKRLDSRTMQISEDVAYIKGTLDQADSTE